MRALSPISVQNFSLSDSVLYLVTDLKFRLCAEAAKIARRPKTTTVVAQQPPRIRRALADVSNLVNGRAALPVVNRQKAAAAAADKCRKPIKQRNENNKAAKPEVIVISSDSEKHKKNPAQRAASRRAPIQTLTSILTKCSRVCVLWCCLIL